RGRVEVVVQLLHVLAVVALGARQPEQALLENRIPSVPQCQGEAHPALPVGEAQEAILAPAVRPTPGMIMREVIPALPVLGVIFPHRSPLALGQIGPPALPVALAPSVLREAPRFGSSHGNSSRRRLPPYRR